MTNGDIIYKFKELTDKDKVSSESGWSDSFIFDHLLDARALVIRQRKDNLYKISRFIQMETPCLKLIPSINCPCVTPNGCEPLETELIIPRSIVGVLAVTNPDGTQVYSEVEASKLKYRLNTRFDYLNNKTLWFSEDVSGNGTKIYVVSKKNLEFIKVTLIPEDPREVQRMIDCSGKIATDCISDYDLEWKLDSALTAMVLDITMKRLLRAKAPISDIKNNNIDDNISNKQELIGTNS
jgi:hypothetical protein